MLKRAWAWEICPGSSITLTLWRGTRSPCTRSLLVAQKWTVEPAGTRISLGANDQICPVSRTSYCPGAISVTPGSLKSGCSATFVESMRPRSPTTVMPAPSAVTASAVSMLIGSAMLGRIQASSHRYTVDGRRAAMGQLLQIRR